MVHDIITFRKDTVKVLNKNTKMYTDKLKLFFLEVHVYTLSVTLCWKQK